LTVTDRLFGARPITPRFTGTDDRPETAASGPIGCGQYVPAQVRSGTLGTMNAGNTGATKHPKTRLKRRF